MNVRDITEVITFTTDKGECVGLFLQADGQVVISQFHSDTDPFDSHHEFWKHENGDWVIKAKI